MSIEIKKRRFHIQAQLGNLQTKFQLIWLKYGKVKLKMVYFVWKMNENGTSNDYQSGRK
jgi:hypothetical protein